MSATVDALPSMHRGQAPAIPLETGPVDLERAAGAVVDLLDALGLDADRDGLVDTPARVARMLGELLTPAPLTATTFPNDAGYEELVLVTDIGFTALCAHHLLPFRGVAHVGYVPGERLIGLSKLARLVEAFARRPQLQERLTAQVADWLHAELAPRGVGVVISAEHLCMSIRGVRADSARTITSTLHGALRDHPASRQEFLHRTGAHERPHQ